MKKILFSIFGLLCIGMACYALPTSSVLLQHKGNVVVYPLDSLNAALRDAVDDDTLFLSKGGYPSFTIDKKITVRGAGEETIVGGTITVAIPRTVTLTSTLIEGLRMNDYNGDINVTMPVNGFKIKQCAFFNLNLDALMYDAVIDRCLCNNTISIPSNVKSLNMVNSKIRQCNIKNVSTNDISMINCMTKGFVNGYNFRGAVINSIVGWPGNAQYNYTSCSFINSLVCTYRLKIDETCYVENCWTSDNENLVKNPAGTTFYCIFSDEELLEKGYVGNDSTVIGTGGGTTPYTLELAVPKVQSSDVKLDNENRKLNVNLILTAE